MSLQTFESLLFFPGELAAEQPEHLAPIQTGEVPQEVRRGEAGRGGEDRREAKAADPASQAELN